MFAARDAPHGLNECLPGLPLLGEHATPFRRHLVKPSPTFVGLLDPRALDPATLFETIEQWIEGIDVKFELAARPRFDQLAEVIAVSRAGVEEREYQEFRGTLLQLAIECAGVYTCHRQIVSRQI
jgi:hypothetical protein